MKYITNNTFPAEQDNKGLTIFFPRLKEFENSTRVGLCGFRPSASMFFSHFKYNVLVIAMYGDYEKTLLDDILALSNIRKDQHIVIPSTVNFPDEYVLPENVHWIVTKSMYSVYTKNIKYVTKDRPPVKKQFISVNHRFTWFRQELFYYLYTHKLLDSSYFAYEADDRFNEGKDVLFKRASDIIGDKKYIDIEKACSLIPYKNFVEHNPPVKNAQVVDFRNIQDMYNTAAIGIESETFLEDYLDYNPGLTEKTMRPLILGNPFLVYNNRGTLTTLKEMGFETFNKIIDESYDDILNPQQRFEAILKEVGRLSKEDPAKLLHSVNDILDHNQEHAMVTLVNQAEQDEEAVYNLIKSLL